jgi:hypothetical protein
MRPEMIGKRFGRLTVISESEKQGIHRAWNCICDCGGNKTALGTNLRRNLTGSCGCLHKERTSEVHSTHGLSKKPIYTVWRNMLARCANVDDLDYGGRGIEVCADWKSSFDSFYRDMGDLPTAEHSIDRSDPDGNYEKSNCRWATNIEQARNTRSNRIITFSGLTCTLAEHCERAELNYAAVHQRLRRGWSIEKSLSTPIRSQ